MQKTSKVIIRSKHGGVQGKYWKTDTPGAPIMLILPSHPSTGMTYDNILLYNIFNIAKEAGMNVLRINFDEEKTLKDDVKLNYSIDRMMSDSYDALQWLTDNNPDSTHYMICGFSIGANTLMNVVSRRPEIENFIAISPVVGLYNFEEIKQKKIKIPIKSNAIKTSDFSASTLPNGLYIYADKDEFLSNEEHEKVILECQKKNKNIESFLVKNSNHYITNTDAIKETLEQVKYYINIALATRIVVPIKKKRRKRKKRDDVSFV